MYGQVGLCDTGSIHEFLKAHFLHWLEALSLIRSMSSAVATTKKLENLLAVSTHSLTSNTKSCFVLS
jgi:hypothetical protein